MFSRLFEVKGLWLAFLLLLEMNEWGFMGFNIYVAAPCDGRYRAGLSACTDTGVEMLGLGDQLVWPE